MMTHSFPDEDEDDIYNKDVTEEMINEEDEITDVDEGFMKGYESGEKVAKCPICKEVLEDDFVEREIRGDVYRFCSDEHAELFLRKLEGEIEE